MCLHDYKDLSIFSDNVLFVLLEFGNVLANVSGEVHSNPIYVCL